MKQLFFIIAIFSIFVLSSCDKETDVVEEVNYDYHAHIKSPSADVKQVGDSVHVHVVFESHSGEVVHNVNVRVYNKKDNTEIYNEPKDGHVHAMSGVHEFHGNILLTEANGVTGHTDWVLEAKVWGKEGAGEVMETLEFHVHPN